MRHFKFSTSFLPPSLTVEQRIRHWLALIEFQGEQFADVPKPNRFEASMNGLVGNNLMISGAYASSVRLTRSREHIARDGKDSIMLLVCDGAGRIGGRQARREAELQRGDALLVASTIPHETYAIDGGNALSIIIPTAVLMPGDGDAERFACQFVPRDSAPLQLLISYARLLLMKPALAASTEALEHAITAHCVSLLGLAMNMRSDADRQQAVDDVRVNMLLETIDQHCVDPEVDAEWIGRRMSLSARSVQHLMQRHGTTLSDEIRSARLRRAEKLLRESTKTVTDIAFDCGFSDVSTFYRAFRQRYGMTPNDLRDKTPTRE